MDILRKIIPVGKKYRQSDNRGIYQKDIESAENYWFKREKLKKYDPFVLYEFDDETDAVTALLSLDFIKIAEDTEELVCLKPLIYGYYELENGKYEAIICGKSMDAKTFSAVEKAFRDKKGRKINSKKPESKKAEPAPRPLTGAMGGKIAQKKQQPVKAADRKISAGVPEKTVNVEPKAEFVSEEKIEKRGMDYIFRTYKAASKAEAVAFLQTKIVTDRSTVIIVRTPRGSLGRNYSGIFIPGKKSGGGDRK